MNLDNLGKICRFIEAHPRLVLLTGAGCSTGSGIGDYRDQEGRWKRPQPVMHQAFVAEESVRRRYWARSMLGWPSFAGAEPNPAHHALAALERAGRVCGLITQNVDGLHQASGSDRVIDLHGRLADVVCLQCGGRSERSALQSWLTRVNADLVADAFTAAPDGDADIERDPSADFRTPRCDDCGGILKPDVVFYGGRVPKSRVKDAYDLVDSADGLLVVGSSLMVYSAFRFVRHAQRIDLPMAAINKGRTRADELLSDKLEATCEKALPAICAELNIAIR
ncbi:MAG: NAD-dependent protein deacetylase [Proteobacteria bacterium]|nr:NAD-dependent protein deacetylase [Pseudomonadota bacterium]